MGAVKTLAKKSEDKTKEDIIIKQLNKNTYNDLVLAQYYTVFPQLLNNWSLNTYPMRTPYVRERF